MKTLKLIILLAIVALSACKPDPVPPKQTLPSDDKGKGDCQLTGVLSNDECLPSVLNGFAIVDDATGIFLAPCESNVPIPQNLRRGDKVEFSYEEVHGSLCEKLIVCQREITSPYKFVRITCFKTKNVINQ